MTLTVEPRSEPMKPMKVDPEALRICRCCRFSEAFEAPPGTPDMLYCNLQEDLCKHPCPGFERYPGCEGDDD